MAGPGVKPSANETEACLGVEASLGGKAWRLRLTTADERLAEAIAQQCGLDIMAARALAGRGVTAERADAFLDPQLARDLPDPSHLQDLDKGVKRLADAIENKEKIAVFGDYDVDGATSSALIARYLKAAGFDAFEVYIPDRRKEGYGPNTKALLALGERGAKVVVTVDCGTLAYQPLKRAKEAGLDVIVVDHHEAEPELPPAFAVINPNRMDEQSPHRNLAAVGVAFLVLVGLNRELRARGAFEGGEEPDLLSLLDLVALGTVADVVQLTGLNRTLVAQGLKVMGRRQNPGLAALMEVAGVNERLSAYHLGFLLGPRVNAGGRVGEAPLGARLLATDDEAEAREIAATLDAYNRERQQIEAAVEAEALLQAFSQAEGGEETLVFAAGQGWHEGVIGIVAGRLREKFGLPAFVFSIAGDGTAKGSARSLPGVNAGAAVLDALHHQILKAGGGHPMAAGMTLPEAHLPKLKEFLKAKLGPAVAKASRGRTLELDGILAPKGASVRLAEALEKIGPFGPGHAAPRFALAGLTVVKADVVGKDHVRLLFSGRDGGRVRGIAFRAAEQPLGRALLKGRGRRFHVAGRLKRDEYLGAVKVDLVVEDAAPAP